MVEHTRTSPLWQPLTPLPLIRANTHATPVLRRLSLPALAIHLDNGQYEFFFPPLAVAPEGYTISTTAQLGAGATATNWKVDLFDFLGTGTWDTVEYLTGGKPPAAGHQRFILWDHALRNICELF